LKPLFLGSLCMRIYVCMLVHLHVYYFDNCNCVCMHVGEFEPELLLLYSLERINLPSGKNMFTWLMRQVIVQRYFVSLFW